MVPIVTYWYQGRERPGKELRSLLLFRRRYESLRRRTTHYNTDYKSDEQPSHTPLPPFLLLTLTLKSLPPYFVFERSSKVIKGHTHRHSGYLRPNCVVRTNWRTWRSFRRHFCRVRARFFGKGSEKVVPLFLIGAISGTDKRGYMVLGLIWHC